MKKGKVYLICFLVLFVLLGCSNPFWSLKDEPMPGELTGTISISPEVAVIGIPITITYTPGPGESAFPGGYKIEWLKESPPGSGKFVSVSKENPFNPTDPGTYKVNITDPVTGKIKEQVLIINDPVLPVLPGNIGITGTGKTGDPLTGTYSGSEGPVTYQWYRQSPPPVTHVSSSNPYTPTVPGTYVVVTSVPGYNPKVSDPIVVAAPSTQTGEPLTGTIFISPATPEKGNPVTITYIPGPDETVDTNNLTYEWFKENPAGSGKFVSVSTANPFNPTDPGTYKVKVTDPTTGKVKEQVLIINEPTLTDLTGDIDISGTGKTGDPLTGTYSGTESPVTYQWYREVPSPVTPVSTSETFTPTVPGTYVVVTSVPNHNPKVSDPITVTTTGGLTGTIGTSPSSPGTGIPVTVTYTPGSGDPDTLDPATIDVEWFKEGPPGTFVSVSSANPFMPTEPGTYKVVVKDPVTGRLKEEIITVSVGAGLYTGTFTSVSFIPAANFVVPVTSDAELSTAFTDHVNSGTGAYTLVIDRDLDNTTWRSFAANQQLTILGIGSERTIRHTLATNNMFRVDGNSATLTIGANIRLTGVTVTTLHTLVYVGNGTFTMLDGSKISGFNTAYHGGAVSIGSTNAVFIMEGGEISGNSSSASASYSAGGLRNDSGSITIRGNSRITGNTIGGGANRDIAIRQIAEDNTGSFTLAGYATIGHILIDSIATAGVNTRINTGGAFTGSIAHLYLRFDHATTDPNVMDAWVDRQVITGTNINAIRSVVDGKTSFLNNTGATTSLGPLYHINSSGILTEGQEGFGNLFLNGNPVAGMQNVTVTKAVEYVNENAGASNNYTLRMIGNERIYASLTLINDARLTLESSITGAGGEMILTHSGVRGQRMFILEGNANTSLTLGNNITLTLDPSALDNYGTMIQVESGNLIMKTGSKITGFKTLVRQGAVFINSANASFNMEGGEISGNFANIGGLDSVGGVYVVDGTFTMSGGRITGNTTTLAYGSNVANVSVFGADNINISGQSHIESLTLNAATGVIPTLNITGNLTDTGNACILNLVGSNTEAGVKTLWEGTQIINGSVTTANIARFTLGEFRWTGIGYSTSAGSHHINASGVLTVGAVLITPVAGNLYLGSPDALTAHLMEVTTDAHLNTAFTTYINSGTGEYTLYLGTSLNNTAQRNFAANQKLTIIGLGGERTITHTGARSTGMFLINSDTASLTLGNNITLTRSNVGSLSLIEIRSGDMIMLDGSKITGNRDSDTRTHRAGGVYIYRNGRLTMKGGSITGNTRGTGIPADIYVNNGIGSGTQFNISGNAEIGHIILDSPIGGGANTSISATNDLFTGSIEHVYLFYNNSSYPTVRTNWSTRNVITGTGDRVAIRNKITAVDFLNNANGVRSILAANYEHHINDSGVLTPGLAPTGNLHINGSPVLGQPIITLTDAVTYINSNASAGVYTLYLSGDETVSGGSAAEIMRLNSNVKLILESTGGERKIIHGGDANQSLFRIGSNTSDISASLTLGNNITLEGRSAATSALVYLGGGDLIMESGSKITGHSMIERYAAVQVMTGTFTMNGGEISGNHNTYSSVTGNFLRSGGVFVFSSVTGGGGFVMNGGTVTGNTPEDVRLNSTAIMTLSGVSPKTIGRITLMAQDIDAARGSAHIYIPAGTSNISVSHLDLMAYITSGSTMTPAEVRTMWRTTSDYKDIIRGAGRTGVNAIFNTALDRYINQSPTPATAAITDALVNGTLQ